MTHNEIELPLSSGCPGSPVKKDAPNKAAGNSEKAPWHHPGMGSCFHLKSCAMNGIRHKMKFTIAIVFLVEESYVFPVSTIYNFSNPTNIIIQAGNCIKKMLV